MLPVITAFSLGVHAAVFLSLGLLTDGNPALRAYRRFVAAVALWLIFMLLAALDIASPWTRTAAGVMAHFLAPLFILLHPLPITRPLGRGALAAVIVFALVLLPFTITTSPWFDQRLEVAYFVAAWGAVAWRVSRAVRAGPSSDNRARRRTVGVALVIGSAAIGLLAAFGALVAIPLVAAAIQAVVLYATVRLSLYASREGATRTGALAADVAERDRRAVAGEIAAMVAHEVRNPMTGVRSLAQRLADDTVDDGRRRQYAGLIVREVDRVERLIGALLGASSRRRGSEAPGHTHLAELFEDVALLVSGRYRRANVQLIVEPAAMTVAAPREPLAQVLLNFLLNAVAQSPKAAHVRLCARAARDGRVEIRVEDDGPGVPADLRDQIFAPFYSGTEGSGLGLAVVRRLAEEREWQVRIDETRGGGATFVIAVPVGAAA